MQLTPFTIPLWFSGIVSILLIIRRRFEQPGGKALVFLLVSNVLWNFGYALELLQVEMDAMVFWSKFQYFGLFIIPVAFVIFALRFTERVPKITGRTLALLLSIPAVTLFLAFTNEHHGLIWSRQWLVSGPYLTLEREYGVGFFIFLGYSAVSVVLSVLLLFRFALGTRQLYGRQVTIASITALIPLLIGIATTSKLIDIPPIRPTALIFGVLINIMAWRFSILRRQDLVRVSIYEVFKNIPDPLVLLNESHRIIDVNVAFEDFLGYGLGEIKGYFLEQVSSSLFDQVFPSFSDSSTICDVELGKGEGQQFFEVHISPIVNHEGRIMSRILLLRDVTGCVREKNIIGGPYSEREKLVSRQEALLEATLAINSSLDQDKVLATIAEQMCEALHATSAFICGYDMGSQYTTVLAEYYSRHATMMGRISDLGDSYHLPDVCPDDIARLLTGDPRIAQLDDPELSEQQKTEMVMYGVKTVLTIPIKLSESLLAWAEIWESRPRRNFTPEEILLGQGIARHAAVTIQQARLLAETEKRLQEQTFLRETISAISSALDLEVVLSRIAERLCRAVNATSAYICDWDYETNVTTVMGDYKSPHACSIECRSDLGESYVDDNVEEFFLLMSKGEAEISHVDDPGLEVFERDHMLECGANTVLYIPLHIRNRPIAIAEIWESRHKREFSEEEIELVRVIAQHAAIAIDHARMYQLAKQEIDDRKWVEELLLHETLHDALTGLPNRTLFLDRLLQAIRRYRREINFAVLFIDLDHFKLVNDSLGHYVGDQLLVAVGQRMMETLRETDTIARLGGDEFVILLDGIKDSHEAIFITERLISRFDQSFMVGPHEIYTSPSIGIVVGSQVYSNPDELLRDADIAMYRAKAQGGTNYIMFDGNMHKQAQSIHRLMTDLRHAIDRQEFVIEYQPIVDLESECLCGFEALLRWNHPTKGLIMPGEFIPLAENTGLIHPIGQWVLQETCRQMAAWKHQYPMIDPLIVSVNLSGIQLRNPKLVDQVKNALELSCLKPDCLALEITETAIIDDRKKAASVLDELKTMGIKIHLDDFGSGHSSMNLLHELPIDTIKIDRSFIARIPDNTGKYEIVRMIISLGESLDKQVVAEGIETLDQLELLREYGDIWGQGFYFSKPLNATDASLFLQSHLESQLISVQIPRSNGRARNAT